MIENYFAVQVVRSIEAGYNKVNFILSVLDKLIELRA